MYSYLDYVLFRIGASAGFRFGGGRNAKQKITQQKLSKIFFGKFLFLPFPPCYATDVDNISTCKLMELISVKRIRGTCIVSYNAYHSILTLFNVFSTCIIFVSSFVNFALIDHCQRLCELT